MKAQTQHIAVNLADGTVAIMQFVTFGRGDSLPFGAEWFSTDGYWTREANDTNVQIEIDKTFGNEGRIGTPMPTVTSWKFIEESEIPKDRTYRNSWIHDGKTIMHDMVKARELHRDRLREERKPHFAVNDIALRDALVDGSAKDKKTAIQRRAYLRDITIDSRIEAAQTVDELKSVVIE